MDRVGELVIAQSRLKQLAAASANAKGVAEEIERLASSLRDTTMGIRMLPIGSLFGRFRRLVHDLSRDLGKEIELVTEGEETELDKTMIERLADPLIHLIRNAVDHGLESAEARRAAGKPTAGPYPSVGAPCRRRGADQRSPTTAAASTAPASAPRPRRTAWSRPAPASPTAELFQLLFQPGFSTAREVISAVRPRRRHGRGAAGDRGHARLDRRRQRRPARARRSRCACR